MAVESTPERSFSLLLSTSRAAEATTGCGAPSEMRRAHHRVQRHLERPRRIGQEIRDTAQRLVGFGIEHMQDGADQERMARLLPVIAPLERAFGIDQDVRDVLHVAYFMRAAPHFEQRVVRGGASIGRVEQQAMRETSRATLR